ICARDRPKTRCVVAYLVQLSLYSVHLLSFFVSAPTTTALYTLPYTTLFRSRRAPAGSSRCPPGPRRCGRRAGCGRAPEPSRTWRSEEHTSELQSRENLVCRLLLEKKKEKQTI